jgi:hypothetical protein
MQRFLTPDRAATPAGFRERNWEKDDVSIIRIGGVEARLTLLLPARFWLRLRCVGAAASRPGQVIR